jgi:MFS family permease
MIMFFSLFLASYARDYWQFFLLQGVCFGIGCAIAYFPALTVISHYFKNRLGIAVGAAVSGSGIGGLILAPLTRYLITNYGVSISLRIHAIIGGSLVIICSYFLKPRLPTLSRDSINYSKIIKDARFIRLFMTAVFASFGYFIPFFFIPVYAKYYGMSTSQGALIVGLTNGASAIGRIFLGIFADRFGHVNLLWTCLTMAPISVLTIWPFAQHFPSLALFGIAYGFFIGGFISLFPTAIQKLFGQNNIATITGMVYSGFFIGNLFGAPIAAIVLDLLTTEKDGKTTIYFLPTIVVPGGMILISSMLILNIKLIVGSGTFFRKV